jgi:hypothetical protein
MRDIRSFNKGEDLLIQIRYFVHLISMKDDDRLSEIILRGYIYQHEDACLNQNCLLKTYKASLML